MAESRRHGPSELQVLDDIVVRLQRVDVELAVGAAQLRILGLNVDAHQLTSASELIESVEQAVKDASRSALDDVAADRHARHRASCR